MIWKASGREFGKKITREECYRAFEKTGLNYGEAHRAIRELYTDGDRALAWLELPKTLEEIGRYILHPGIIDGALQAALALLQGKNSLQLSLPYALESLEILNECTEKMWALARRSKGVHGEGKTQKLDMEVCSEDGIVCVRMKGFVFRELEGNFDPDKKSANLNVILLEPVWQEKEIKAIQNSIHYEKRLVILCEISGVEKEDPASNYLHLDSKEKKPSKRYEEYAVCVFNEIQKILRSKPEGDVLIQVLMENKEEKGIFSGMSGLLKTARQENPRIKWQIITVNESNDLSRIIEENAGQIDDEEIRYDEDNKRRVLRLLKIESMQKEAPPIWKNEGVYLITGGLGGLGLILAKEIGIKTKGVRLILAGRSKITENKENFIKELESMGVKAEYRAMDAANKKEAASLIGNIREEYGCLNGIIHCAGIIKDSFIIKKTIEEFLEVLAPKVEGLINLDEMTKDMNLDFVILFSSIAGAFGNIGQADYACGNAFMDRYAEYRNLLVSQKKRRGKTVSINWPLWAEGGMKLDDETKKMMLGKWALVPLKTENGIKAMYRSYDLNKSEIIVLEGDINKIDNIFIKNETNDIPEDLSYPETKESFVIDKEIPEEKAINYFKRRLSEVMKLSFDKIRDEEEFEKYGIDSVMVMQLTSKLEESFGVLSKTLFFEYRTLKEITGYFLKNYKDKLHGIIGLGGKWEKISRGKN